MDKYREVLAEQTGATVIAIASYDTPFMTIRVPDVDGFNGYIRLMAGWNMLVAAGLAGGVNIDKTIRARKVGNEIRES
jgi:glucosamine--fructose-6-phosphate aminotransferase (isomerizing)